MKSPSLTSAAARTALVAGLALALFSFTFVGGNSYKVYLNNKLIVDQYLTRDAKTPVLNLESADAGDKLQVHFNECGQIGTQRSLTLKDGQNKVLKSWSYKDAAKDANTSPVVCSVADIQSFQKGKGNLTLVYASKFIPEGVALAVITTDPGVASVGQ
jgi:hypothetical protein